MRSSMPRFFVAAVAALCLWGSAAAQDPRDLAQDIVGDGGYQTELPGEGERVGGGFEEAGGGTVRPREPRLRRLAERDAAGLGLLPWIVLGVAVVIGAFLVVRGSIEAGRDVRIGDAEHDAPAAGGPVPFDPGAGPLEDAERLAREGRFGEAVRVLLHRTIDALRGRCGFAPAPWMTSREILRRAPLERGARDGLRALVDAVEHSLFGRREPGRDEYALCAQAYRDLLAEARGGTA